MVELTHLASLYHDDVMDEAALRRGADSANARWDNHVAILTGDFLFSRRSELTAELGRDAVRIQARTFTRLVEGQILETVAPAPGADPLEHYLAVVAGKTGSLIATSALLRRPLRRRAAARSRTPSRRTARASARRSSSATTSSTSPRESDESGKTPGTDLREGVPTLPVLLAQRSDDPADARLLELLDADLTDDALHAETLGPAARATRRWPRPAPTSSRAPTRPRRCSRCSPTARSATPSRPSPTWSPPAPPDPSAHPASCNAVFMSLSAAHAGHSAT